MPVPFSVTLQVQKVEKPSVTVRHITGWAAVVTRDDGVQVIDDDDHITPVNILKRAVQDAFIEAGGGGRVDVNHENGEGASDLAESIVVSNELKVEMNKRSPEFFGSSKREGWIATVRVTDQPTIERIDSGELLEFSLKGRAIGRWV